MDVVAFLTLGRGHVPHHHEGPALQDWTCGGHGGRGGSAGGGLWQGGAEEGREEEEEGEREREARQRHGCSLADVSVLTGERNGLVRFIDEEL